jgi:hypothetical protein
VNAIGDGVDLTWRRVNRLPECVNHGGRTLNGLRESITLAATIGNLVRASEMHG